MSTVGYKEMMEKKVSELQSEVLDQARLNGMGSERESALMAKVAELQRHNAMLVDVIYPMEESARQIFEKHGYFGMAEWSEKLQAARCATSTQSAAWLEDLRVRCGLYALPQKEG